MAQQRRDNPTFHEPPENQAAARLAEVNSRIKELEQELARFKKFRQELTEQAYEAEQSRPAESPAEALKRTSALLAADRSARESAQENKLRRMQSQLADLQAGGK